MANIGAAPPAAATGHGPDGRRLRAPREGRATRLRTAVSGRLAELGAIGVLTRRTVVAVVRPPYTYGPELASQFVFGLRMAAIPLVISSIAFTYGPAGVQAAGFLNLFGAIDRLGGLFAVIVMREFAPLVCAIVMAGVVGTSICADLGARQIREELDALRVLGVDTTKSLVAPRFVALMALASLSNVFALLLGTLGGMIVTLANSAPLGPFFATFFTNATVPEIAASLIKTTLFGAIIAIVCCYKGLTVKGGPEGVGRAVNQAVVISFMAIGVVNYAFTQALLALYPELSVVR
ncbi:MAG TPA: ABC transporter permease [Thermoleophilaceae bacterium]|nr:ABC transporter permease [Thermoleophilaceae bacterium]